MKVLFGKLEGIEESRLLKNVAEKLRDGGIGWCEKYEALRIKLELDDEVELMGRLKKRLKARNEKNWEEVYTKSTLKWYKLAEWYRCGEICEVSTGLGSVMLLFRLRIRSDAEWLVIRGV